MQLRILMKNRDHRTQIFQNVDVKIVDRSMSKESVRWLWPAQKDIYLYDAGDRHGTRKGVLVATFNTAQPLQPHHLTQTLIYLQRYDSSFISKADIR